ncbi:hypothetical protein MHYP_G00359040 [Metynnis hypsauchen]
MRLFAAQSRNEGPSPSADRRRMLVLCYQEGSWWGVWLLSHAQGRVHSRGVGAWSPSRLRAHDGQLLLAHVAHRPPWQQWSSQDTVLILSPGRTQRSYCMLAHMYSLS